MNAPIVKRFAGNPILTRKDVPYAVHTVHNAGMVKLQDRYIMMFRSHLDTGRSIIGMAESTDGYAFTVREKPFIIPATAGVFKEYEAFGVEDPRIAFIEGEYYITYSAYSKHGVRIGLAKTNEFRSMERISLITEADYRNVVLFPEKINGRYVRLDRPHSAIAPWAIWISYSKDLIYWGESELIIDAGALSLDEMKIGPGATPIKTDKGWLSIYHECVPPWMALYTGWESPCTTWRIRRKLSGSATAGFFNRRPVGSDRVCSQCGVQLRRDSRAGWERQNILGRR